MRSDTAATRADVVLGTRTAGDHTPTTATRPIAMIIGVCLRLSVTTPETPRYGDVSGLLNGLALTAG
jgi:hypothetical protein